MLTYRTIMIIIIINNNNLFLKLPLYNGGTVGRAGPTVRQYIKEYIKAVHIVNYTHD